MNTALDLDLPADPRRPTLLAALRLLAACEVPADLPADLHLALVAAVAQAPVLRARMLAAVAADVGHVAAARLGTALRTYMRELAHDVTDDARAT